MKPKMFRALAFVTLLFAFAWQLPADQIRRKSGGAVTGDVQEITPESVTVKSKNKQTQIDALDIDVIYFTGQPAALDRAKKDYLDGKYEDVLKDADALAKETPKKPAIAADLMYIPAAAAGQLALAGKGELAPAKAKLTEFVSTHGKNFQMLPAVKMLAEIAVLESDAEGAFKHYETLSKAKSAKAKKVGYLGVARVLVQQNKVAEARTAAEQLGKLVEQSDETLNAETKLILATCDAADGKTDEASTAIYALLQNLPVDQPLLYAQAYNTLGYCHQKGGRMQEAAIAYLHTDLVYFQNAAEHAKALKNLVVIWEQLNRPDRANEAKRILQERYPQLN